MNQLMFQQHHKLWVILPAAGSGSRFSKTELKQYPDDSGTDRS